MLQDSIFDAILYIGYPGAAGARPAMRVLAGKVNPSGRLTDSWAMAYEDYPSSSEFKKYILQLDYSEDIFVGYRYFSTFPGKDKRVVFPFGFGLSYTDFKFDNLSLTREQDKWCASVRVTNSGDVAGRESVQLYLAAPQGKLGRPARELVAFAKTRLLAPGENEICKLYFRMEDHAAFDDTGKSGNSGCYVLEAGNYQLHVGNSSVSTVPCGDPIQEADLRVVRRTHARLMPTNLQRRLLANGSYEPLVAPKKEVPDLNTPHEVPPEGAYIECEAYERITPGARIEDFLLENGTRNWCIAAFGNRTSSSVVYRLSVKTPGRYEIHLRAANGRAEIPDFLRCKINGTPVDDIQLKMPSTGQWYHFIDLPPFLVSLPAGEVELEFMNNGKVFPNIDCFFIIPEANAKECLAGLLAKRNLPPYEGPADSYWPRERGNNTISFQELCKDPQKISEFITQLGEEDLIFLAEGHSPTIRGGTGLIGALPAFGLSGWETCDGPHGVRSTMRATFFPALSLLACGFDSELAFSYGNAIGREAAEQKFSILLGPGLNIHRDPLGGRNFEYLSEDPILTGVFGAALIRGIQSAGVAAVPKHFAANNRERARNKIDARISERALRELYLRGFEMAIRDGGAFFIMSSYNKINGVEASETPALLTGILRQEWGFNGAVMSDWSNDSLQQMEIRAGNNIKMPKGNAPQLLQAVKRGIFTHAELERNAADIFSALIQLQRLQKKAQ